MKFFKIIALFFVFVFLFQFIFADSNGIWYPVKDFRGNIFGGDEQQSITNFTFINNVYFQQKVIFNSNIGIGVLNPSYTLEVNGKIKILNSTTDEDSGKTIVTKDYLMQKLDVFSNI